jgi:D-glycero-beta-D-manno-heptose-7-phosphate kinase
MAELNGILAGFSKKNILVLGDIMLDHYIWGKVDRISPEAPVPVLDVQKEEYRLGGAANVALNLKALGAGVTLCGVIGNDYSGGIFMDIMVRKGLFPKAIVVNSKRATTLKTRVGAVNQQIVRLDYENRKDIPANLEKAVLSKLEKYLPESDALIIEDYNKGLLTETLIMQAIKLAKQLGKPVAVDPKQKNFFHYKQVDVFKPNYSEMQKNLGVIFETETEFDGQAKQLKAKLKCKNLVITRGEKGLYVYSDSDKVHHIPTFAREVFDVSGAGDTVISVLTLAICAGCDIHTAAVIANHAAGVVCAKMGTATASIREIRQSFNEHAKNN